MQEKKKKEYFVKYKDSETRGTSERKFNSLPEARLFSKEQNRMGTFVSLKNGNNIPLCL